MKPNQLHFSFFIFVLLFFSCNEKECTVKEDVQANHLIDKALVCMENQKFDRAFFYFNEAKEVSKNSDNKVYSLIRMANIQITQCDFSGSEASVTEAMQINKNIKNNYYIYNTLGIDYLEQLDFETSLKYYNYSYQYASSEQNKLIVSNNIGVVNLEKKDYTQAIKILEPILTNHFLTTDKKNYPRVLDNLGYAYFKTNNVKAYTLLSQSLRIRDSLNDHEELIASYMHMAEYYQNDNPELAMQWAQKAYQSAKLVNSPDDKIEALKFWIANAEPTLAKKLALKQIVLSDSINKVRQKAKNQFAKIKYDSKKALQEKEHFKNQKESILKSVVIVFALIVFIFYRIRIRSRKKLEVSVYNTEIRIAKKIHDELANDVFQAMTFAETQDLQNPDKRETLVDNLDNIYTRTRNISQQNSEIPTGENFREPLLDLLNSFNSTKVSVVVNNSQNIEWKNVKKEAKITIYRVLQELMVNMKKHSQSSVVIISFASIGKTIEVKYSDNGKGTQQMTVSKKGLQNVENRIRESKGTIIFEPESAKGFRVTITIPK